MFFDLLQAEFQMFLHVEDVADYSRCEIAVFRVKRWIEFLGECIRAGIAWSVKVEIRHLEVITNGFEESRF